MRASTCVAVEISYNQSNDLQHAFRAEVDFVTVEERADEFDILITDIKNRPVSEQLVVGSGTDASMAFAKLSALYPGVSISRLVDMSPFEPANQRELSKVLGKSITVQGSTAPEFSEAVNVYIDSSNKGTGADEFAYWPLVRMVRVFVTLDILKSGLVLVDLPGLGDSNAGRTQVAANYIKELRHMWVVADIVRAIDDGIAKELISRSFKRQLLMAGRYYVNFVTFIMTKADQVTTHEVIHSLKLGTGVLKEEVAQETRLTNEMQSLKEALTQHKQQQKELRRSLRKFGDQESSSHTSSRDTRKCSLEEAESEVDVPQISIERKQLLTDLESEATAEKEVNDKVLKLIKAISALNTKMRKVCIGERNKYTQHHLEVEFKNGQGELVEEMEAAGGSVSLSELLQGDYQAFYFEARN